MKAFIKDAPFGVSVIFIILAIGFVYIAAPIFGNSALIVRSGSMQPQIAVGDLAVVKKQADGNYKAGDIIAFKNANNSKTLTTHRIAGIENKNSQIFYETKGDANKTVDRELISTENVIGKAYFRLPYLGKLIAFTKTSTGFALAVIFPALLVIAFETQNIFKEIKKQKTVPSKTQQQPDYPIATPIIEIVDLTGFSNHNKLIKFPSLKILLPILASALLVYNSFAFFSATATSTGNIFTAASVFTNHLVISEVQITGGPTNTTNDFIELYNPTSSAINLDGYRLVKRTGSNSNDTSIIIFTSSNIIPAHGFFLWANSGFASSIAADVSTTDTLAASNSIALRFGPLDTGTIIDALSWNSSVNSLKEGTEFSPDPGANGSMERKALTTSTASTMAVGGSDQFKGNGFDSNNNATDFILRPVSQPQNSGSATESP